MLLLDVLPEKSQVFSSSIIIMAATKLKKVLVVGAGPSGILLALLLAQHGIKVEVVEALDDLDNRPRGVGYGPAAVE